MTEDNAVKVDRVYKNFLLPHEKTTTIKSAFLGLARKKHSSSTETQHALADISFEVKKGEFLGIVGRNGSGKSTLLKILAGIYQPTKGNVSVTGKLVPFIELGVGFNPELSGRDNVYLNGALLGFNTAQVDEMYEDIVSFAELEKFMDQKLKNYSSGMQVRLAFSMAVRAKADILLIDEVLAVGDADFQRKCFHYFKTLKKLKKTVVFVSHDMNAVKEFCDRVILIDRSKLVSEGKPEIIANKYTRLFIDESENAQETLESDTDEGRFGTGALKISDVKLQNDALTDKDNELRLSMNVKASKDIEDIVFGFSVKDAEGEPICGSNTQLKQVKINKISAGEIRHISWSCENIFADGKHTVTVAGHNTDGVTMYDWWPEAAHFTVRRKERSAYRISPAITVDIS